MTQRGGWEPRLVRQPSICVIFTHTLQVRRAACSLSVAPVLCVDTLFRLHPVHTVVCRSRVNHLISLVSKWGYCSGSKLPVPLKAHEISEFKKKKKREKFWVQWFFYPLAPSPGRIDLHINWTCGITLLLKLICFITAPYYPPGILQQAFNFIFHIVLCSIMLLCYLIKCICLITPTCTAPPPPPLPPLFPLLHLFFNVLPETVSLR